MRQSAVATRARLIAAAETLFAEQGIDAVSMNQVQRAAGQRNKSALQYHFGTKEQLLEAILDKHVPGIEMRRHRWLDGIEASGRYEIRELMKALVVPVFEKLDDPDGGRAYITIQAQIIGSPGTFERWSASMRANRGVNRLMRMLDRVCTELPPPVRRARYLLVTELLFHSISDFGRLSTLEPPLFQPSGHDLFSSNLVDVLSVLAAAPVSSETLSLLPAAPNPRTPVERSEP